MAEDKFEHAVIDKLKSEGWEYLTDYSGVTVDWVHDHWRDILDANNRKRLEDTPLSDNEFEQVKLELTKNKTPYDAQLMLAGAGGVGTVPLNRDDGTQLELEIFYGDEVAGGHSRYEVVNQITFTDLATSLSSKRRIDIMLLINGLSVAHIEEKDQSLQNQWNAFEQFQKYDGDGMCTGLFSFVQVQFVLSQNSAHYFARPKNSHSYNRDFAFGWRDDDGKDVTQSVNCATINHHENRRFARGYYYNLSNSSTQYLIRQDTYSISKTVFRKLFEYEKNKIELRRKNFMRLNIRIQIGDVESKI